MAKITNSVQHVNNELTELNANLKKRDRHIDWGAIVEVHIKSVTGERSRVYDVDDMGITVTFSRTGKGSMVYVHMGREIQFSINDGAFTNVYAENGKLCPTFVNYFS